MKERKNIFEKLKFIFFSLWQVRAKISDFGVVITIGTMVLIDSLFGFNTPKLNVPLKFQVDLFIFYVWLIYSLNLIFYLKKYLKTTKPNRGWLINPIQRIHGDWWLIFLAIIPAILLTILVFMDQHITVLIVNRKENKFKVKKKNRRYKKLKFHLLMFIFFSH